MAYQTITGMPIEHSPPTGYMPLAPSFTASTAIAATGDKIAMIGRYWNPARASKNIRRICFEWGAITKAGGSAMTLSLQDVDLANGPTIRPDGTQDQTVAVANADAAFLTNTWYRSGTLSADRTIVPGELIAVVCEYDGGGRLSADSVVIRGVTIAGAGPLQTSLTASISSTWTAVGAVVPNVVFEHDDGTFGFLHGCRPCKTFNTHTFKQDTATSDEFALAFTVPAKIKADSIWVGVALAASTSNFNAILYSGTTALETIAIDGNAGRSAAATAQYLTIPLSTLYEFVPGTTYYISLQPSQTTSNITGYSIDVEDANHLGGWPGGPNFNYATRLDAGLWAAVTTTRRFLAGFGPAAWDDGTGGSGGMLFVPNLEGT